MFNKLSKELNFWTVLKHLSLGWGLINLIDEDCPTARLEMLLDQKHLPRS